MILPSQQHNNERLLSAMKSNLMTVTFYQKKMSILGFSDSSMDFDKP